MERQFDFAVKLKGRSKTRIPFHHRPMKLHRLTPGGLAAIYNVIAQQNTRSLWGDMAKRPNPREHEQLPHPKHLRRYALIGRAVARAVTDIPEDILNAYFREDAHRGSMPLAQSIVAELAHAGYRLKDADSKPFAPDDEISPRRRMRLEDYVQQALDVTGAGVRATLKSYDRRNQSDAINTITETICKNFSANKVTLERRKNPWDR